MTLRILVADDHPMVRAALRRLLESNAMWRVCGEATNGLEAVEKSAELTPDVVILDYSMPYMNGFEAARRIGSASPGMPIIIFTQCKIDPEVILQLNDLGVRQIIGKDSPKELLRALGNWKRQLIPLPSPDFVLALNRALSEALGDHGDARLP